MPSSAPEDAIAVVGLRVGEEAIVDNRVAPTAEQLAQMHILIDGLGPDYTGAADSSEQFIDDFLGQIQAAEPGAVRARALADVPHSVVAPTALLVVETVLGRLDAYPNARMAKLVSRPAMAVSVEAIETITGQEFLAHEVTHVRQKITEPVKVYESLQDYRVQALSDELEAYNSGAVISMRQRNIQPFTPAHRQAATDSAQILVDLVRQSHLRSNSLTANAELLEHFTANGLGHIIHDTDITTIFQNTIGID